MEELAPTGRAEDDDRCPRCGAPVATVDAQCATCGGALFVAPELPAGTMLSDGRYQVLSVIGRGGFGITYEAGDVRLHRRVAIKELFPDSAVREGSHVLTPPEAKVAFRAARDRFLREARVLARFTHSGIVRVYEVFEEHGTAYLVMELLGGCPLVDVLRTRAEPFTEDEVLDVAGRVAAALRPVHAAGVLHRDLNPSNVMLTEHGRIVLIDFGLARDFDQSQTVGMTRVVTPGYAPIEQYRGEARFGPSTDVYGLAATCYRLATGRVPIAAIARDAGAELTTVARSNPAFSKGVSDAIGDGLEIEPGHRPQDLDSFLARLGIRRLPEGSRSLLLGSVGAEPDRLRDLSASRSDFRPEAVTPPAPTSPRPVLAPTPQPLPTPLDADQTVLEPAAVSIAASDATLGHEPDVGETEDATAAIGELPPSPVLAPSEGERLLAEPARGARRSVLLPGFILAVAAGSAAPLIVVALVVVLVLPLLATLGDLHVRRLRAANGLASGWVETRAPTWSVAVSRFVRNVAVSVVRCSPIVGVGAVLIALWYLLDQTSLDPTIVDGALRIIGAGTVAALLVGSGQGSPRFRSGVGIDELVRWLAPDGRTTQRIVVGWLVVALLVAAFVWLEPDPFPLP